MNGIHNVNLDGKDEWNLLYLQGTLKEINTKNENILHESINGEMYYMPRKVAVLTFEITDTFSGHPELIAQKERTFRMDVTEYPDFLETLTTEMKQGAFFVQFGVRIIMIPSLVLRESAQLYRWEQLVDLHGRSIRLF